jgi:protein FAM32A
MVNHRNLFVGGSLTFKGDDNEKLKKKKTKKKKSTSIKHKFEDGNMDVKAPPHGGDQHKNDADTDDMLTDAECAAIQKKQERERKDLERLAQMSHRQRVETFNEKLSQLTELNDIPRVSAAGNG